VMCDVDAGADQGKSKDWQHPLQVIEQPVERRKTLTWQIESPR